MAGLDVIPNPIARGRPDPSCRGSPQKSPSWDLVGLVGARVRPVPDPGRGGLGRGSVTVLPGVRTLAIAGKRGFAPTWSSRAAFGFNGNISAAISWILTVGWGDLPGDHSVADRPPPWERWAYQSRAHPGDCPHPGRRLKGPVRAFSVSRPSPKVQAWITWATALLDDRVPRAGGADHRCRGSVARESLPPPLSWGACCMLLRPDLVRVDQLPRPTIRATCRVPASRGAWSGGPRWERRCHGHPRVFSESSSARPTNLSEAIGSIRVGRSRRYCSRGSSFPLRSSRSWDSSAASSWTSTPSGLSLLAPRACSSRGR